VPNLPIKLKSTGIKKVRLDLLGSQNYKCAICNFDCAEDEAVLDHCHKGGHIRAVLHRGCNALLGRVENNAPRHGLKLEQLIAFLAGASAYIDTHRENQTALIHPSHFTAEEKAERRKAKAQKIRAKAKALKLKEKKKLLISK
jgi:DNA-binding sugar fermentation-stimulating protein